MTKIEANVPDYLAKQAFAVAEREKVPVDQIIALALSAQLTAWKGSDDMAIRAKRADLAEFDRIMAKEAIQNNMNICAGSFDRWLRCSSVTDRPGCAPSSRLASGQNSCPQMSILF